MPHDLAVELGPNIDACDAAHAASLLAEVFGLELADLAKAAHAEPWPLGAEDLAALVERARADWQTWGDSLIATLEAKMAEEGLSPEQLEAELIGLLRAHEVSLRVRFTGLAPVLAPGMPKPPVLWPEGPSTIELAFRMGLDHNPIIPTLAPKLAPLPARIEHIMATPLTPQEAHALRYVQRRGGRFMRHTLSSVEGEVTRELTRRELDAVREGLGASVVARESGHAAEDRMRRALVGTKVQNNIERFTRTELADAHNTGAYVVLRRETARAGMASPKVYKLVAGGACKHCRRIWGPSSQPNIYDLADVEAWSAEGNMGRRADDWRAQIGVIHPNCTEGGLLVWDEGVHRAIMDAADALEALE